MTLSEELCAAWRAGTCVDSLMSRLVASTEARAAGCWRLEQQSLKLIGFGWAPDMPVEVSQGFQAATRCVSLQQTGLGIVKAAVTEKPAIALRDASVTGLNGSASWLVKFDAYSSLAAPIRSAEAGNVIGVLAVSTAAIIQDGDPLWQQISCLSRELSLAAHSAG